ncbi:hypothetical protein K501DRAFT_274775 [Backusella circina FSU 941]|nr:hypothetical protein K501DRAFT_274775 [Backusella circina FSU 941]
MPYPVVWKGTLKVDNYSRFNNSFPLINYSCVPVYKFTDLPRSYRTLFVIYCIINVIIIIKLNSDNAYGYLKKVTKDILGYSLNFYLSYMSSSINNFEVIQVYCQTITMILEISDEPKSGYLSGFFSLFSHLVFEYIKLDFSKRLKKKTENFLDHSISTT